MIFYLSGPWSNPIDFLTPLQWFPSRMKTRGRELHDGLIQVYGRMILDVKARMDAGEEEVPDCLVKTLLVSQEKEKLDWDDLCMLSAVFTLGGVASVSICFLLLARPAFISLIIRFTFSLEDGGYYQLVSGFHTLFSSSPGMCV